jgi:hypothetical protein
VNKNWERYRRRIELEDVLGCNGWREGGKSGKRKGKKEIQVYYASGGGINKTPTSHTFYSRSIP